jgi:hypothetical protein
MEDKALKNDRPNRSERKRTPLGQRNRISFNTEEGYHYHLINDKDGRLQKAIEGVGTAKKIGKYVSMPVGSGTQGYLMRIKNEWYNEDQAEKQKKVDATESAMKPNKAKNEYGEGLVTEKL